MTRPDLRPILARVRAGDLPKVPTVFVLGLLAIFVGYLFLPSSDRFGYLFGILTVGVLLVMAEVTIPQSARQHRDVVIDQAVVDALVFGIGILRRRPGGYIERLDPRKYRIRLDARAARRAAEAEPDPITVARGYHDWQAAAPDVDKVWTEAEMAYAAER